LAPLRWSVRISGQQFPPIFWWLSGPHQKRERGSRRWFFGGELAARRILHAEVKGSYGSPRMLEELQASGFPASKGVKVGSYRMPVQQYGAQITKEKLAA
jgi:hypothetical protein